MSSQRNVVALVLLALLEHEVVESTHAGIA